VLLWNNYISRLRTIPHDSRFGDHRRTEMCSLLEFYYSGVALDKGTNEDD